MNNNYNLAQQGWQCPICKRVYSPFTPCCLYCGAEGMAKTSTGWVEHQNDPYQRPDLTSTGHASYIIQQDKDKNICDN